MGCGIFLGEEVDDILTTIKVACCSVTYVDII